MVKKLRSSMLTILSVVMVAFFALSLLMYFVGLQNGGTKTVYAASYDKEYSVDADQTLAPSGSNNGEFVTIGHTGAYQSLIRFAIPKENFSNIFSAKMCFEAYNLSKNSISVTAAICTNNPEGSNVQDWQEGDLTWQNSASTGSNPIRGTYASVTASVKITIENDVERESYSAESPYIVEMDLSKQFLDQQVSYEKTIEGVECYLITMRVITGSSTTSGSLRINSKQYGDGTHGAKMIITYSETNHDPFVYPEGAAKTIKDGYGTTSGGTNSGSSETILVSAEPQRRAVMQFDVTEFCESENLENKYLSLYLNLADTKYDLATLSKKFAVVQVNEDYAESDINWTNTGSGKIFGTRTAIEPISYNVDEVAMTLRINFDTECIRGTIENAVLEVEGRKYLTLFLNGSSGITLSFYSKEGAELNSEFFAPYLTLNSAMQYPQGAAQATKDCYVSASSVNSSFGSSDTLSVSGNPERRIVMEFDVTDFCNSSSLENQYLSLYFNLSDENYEFDTLASRCSILKNTGDWDENNMSWNGIKSIIAERQTATVYGYYFDETTMTLRLDLSADFLLLSSDSESEFYNSLREADGRKYMSIFFNGSGGKAAFNCWSKEGAEKNLDCFAPYLMLNDKDKISSASVTIAENLTVNFYTDYFEYNTFENYSAICTIGDAETEGVLTDLNNGKMKISVSVAPQQMGDSVSVSLLYDGTLTTEYSSFTVKDYLTKLYNEKSASAELKKLVADMLEYGAAAQTFKDYKQDALVNDDETIASSATDYETVKPTSSALKKSGEKYANASFSGVTVYFDGIDCLVFKVTATDISNVSVKCEDKSLEYKEVDGVYCYYLPVCAGDFAKEYTVTLYHDEVAYESITYSVNSYVYGIVEKSVNQNMVNLAKALYKYGYSARIYADSINRGAL